MRFAKTLFLVLVLSMLAACAKKKKQEPERFIDPYLATYIENFVADAQSHGVSLSGASLDRLRVVKFVDSVEHMQRMYGQAASDGDGLAGACTDVATDNRVAAAGIQVAGEEKRWQEIWIANSITNNGDAPAPVLRELMYHELGHCFLGLEHAAPAPHKIMSPSVSGNVAFLSKNWERLVAELFASAKR